MSKPACEFVVKEAKVNAVEAADQLYVIAQRAVSIAVHRNAPEQIISKAKDLLRLSRQQLITALNLQAVEDD